MKEPRPSTLIAWRTYTAIGHSEIEQFRDQLLADPRANRRKIEAEYQKAKADERDAIRMERDWYKRNGLAALKAETDRASKAYDKAGTALTRIRPTTIAGAGALIGYVGYTAHELACECVWHAPAVANAARALLAMPDEALPPSAEQAPDLDLINATNNMHNADCSIDRMHKKYGDDAHYRDDYNKLQIEREEALDLLATRRSRSSNGIIAKARALNESNLIEDNDCHSAVATSLAADVLRHFGVSVA